MRSASKIALAAMIAAAGPAAAQTTPDDPPTAGDMAGDPVAPAGPAAKKPQAEKPDAKPATAATADQSFYVQIAALTDPARAAEIARAVDGKVEGAGALHRVRLGPYATERAAQAARDAVVGRGYGDARIVTE